MVFRVTDTMSSMDDWNVKSFLLDSESSVCGVKDELGGFVFVGIDPFLSGNEVEEGVLRAMTLPMVVEYLEVKKLVILVNLDHA